MFKLFNNKNKKSNNSNEQQEFFDEIELDFDFNDDFSPRDKEVKSTKVKETLNNVGSSTEDELELLSEEIEVNFEAQQEKENKNKKNKKKKRNKNKKRAPIINIPEIPEDSIFYGQSLRNIVFPKKQKKKSNNRFRIFLIFFIVLFLIVIGKVLHLEITHKSHGEDLNKYGLLNTTKNKIVPSERGKIFDSQGKPLAVNVKKYTLIAHLDKADKSGYGYVKDIDKTANELIKILGYEDNENAKKLIKSQLNQNKETNGEIKQVEFGKYANAVTLDQKTKIQATELPGLEFDEGRADRYYPYGIFAPYIIGYAKPVEEAIENNEGEEEVETNLKGEMGVEKRNDAYLKGEDGEYTVQQDINSVENPNTKVVKKNKTDGSDVYLTIDSTIQTYVHDSMEEALKGQSYVRASTVVMRKDGAILAAESFPTFNPNIKDIKDYEDPFFDACYEPGSPIKTFLVAAAIEEGKWNPNQQIQSGKRVDKRWGKTGTKDNYIADWIYNQSGESWGKIDLDVGYYLSSNVAMTYTLDNLTYSKWKDYANNKYEFGQSINTDTMTTNACTYNPEYDFEIATTSFGQGMTSSMASVLKGYSVFLNDGKMVNPYLVEKIEDPETNEVIYEGKTDVSKDWENKSGKVKEDVKIDEETGQAYKEVLSKDTVTEMNKLMQGVMEYDGGGKLKGTGIDYGDAIKHDVIGKTGTSQQAFNGVYQKGQELYSAVILAPADDPEIMVYTIVDRPGTTYPNTYIAKYLQAIVDQSLNYIEKENIDLDLKDPESMKLKVAPNFVGLKDKDYTNNKKYNVPFTKVGKGEVVLQYPQSGAKIPSGTNVLLVGEKVELADLQSLSLKDFQNYSALLGKVVVYEGKGNKIDKVTEEGNNKYKVKLKN